MGPDKTEVIVVGGGITGLSIAYWLKKYGINFTLLAKDNEAGGIIKSVNDQGFIYETGANTALETTPLIKELVKDLHLENKFMYARPESRNGYIFKNGALHLVPTGLGSFLTTRLFSAKSKIRIMKEPFIGRAEKEESVAEYFERRLGRELLDYIIDPFVIGKFGGKPELLSIRSTFQRLYTLEKNYGGLFKGIIKSKQERKNIREKVKKFSFVDGMQTLPNAIAASLGRSIGYNAKVTGICDLTTTRNEPSDKSDSRRYMIEYLQNGLTKNIEADFVILTVPAYDAASIIRSLSEEIAHVLSSINYAPIASVFLGARREDIRIELNGSGFLVPSKEKRQILGCIWNSSIFGNRAPAGMAAINTYIGGSRQPNLPHLSDDRIIQLTLDELKSIMQFSGKPVYLRVIRWNKSIPQYEIGYQQKIETLIQFEESHPGITFAGSYRGGISVGECINNAHDIAKMVSESIISTR